MVDANGRRISVMSDIKDTKGNDLYLTIDARAQYVADAALAKPHRAIGRRHRHGQGIQGRRRGTRRDRRVGARHGELPTFDPTNFTGSIPTELWDKYQEKGAYAPLNNNVVSGQFMAASTFKAFTSLAGLEYGFATEGSSWNCTGKWDGFGTGDVQRCWKHDGHGTLDLHGGIVNSCDTVFYEIGKAFYDHGPAGTGEISETALQDYLGQFGFRREDRHRFGRRGRGRHPHAGLEGRALAERALRRPPSAAATTPI
ncbi:MAG: penicillin-binding transpeptidase domain-containing protein [Adlercreutzia equolifaciens]